MILWFCYQSNFGQTTISGRVYDATNLEALSGATISNSSGDSGTATNSHGYFEWQVPPGTDTVYIRYLGYQEQVLPVMGEQENLRILLSAADFELPQLVVQGTGVSHRLIKYPTSISVIAHQGLARDNQTNIAEPLNRIPGLYMHSGTLNTNRITIRGIGSRSLFSTTKIRAYLNDIPLTTGDGETTLEDVDMSLLDRIEILKGPSSSIYGAGLGGTINMKVGKAPYQKKSISSELSVGSFGLLRNVTKLEISEDKFNIKLNYNNTHQDGYRDNNDYDRQSLSLLTQVYPGKDNVLTFWGAWIDLTAFIPSSLDSAAFAEDPSQAAFTWRQSMGFEDYDKGLIGLNFQQVINPQWDLSISLFGNLRDTYELRPFNILEEESKALGTRFRLNHEPIINKGTLEWIVGGEYFTERYQWRTLENVDREPGAVLSDNDEDRRYFNLFTELTWDLPTGTVLTAGINLNKTNYDYQDLLMAGGMDLSGDYQFEAQWSPRIAVNHQFPSNRALYAQISHGFSPPTLSETLTPDGAINPEIQPETGWNIEVGSRGHVSRSKIWYDVSLYSMFIENLLVARRIGDDQFVGVNAGKTRHRGVDVSLNYTFLELAAFEFHIWTTYAFADYFFKEFVDEGNDFSDNELTGTPRHKFNLGADMNHKSGLYGNINFQSVSSMPITDDNSVHSDAYALLNLKVGYKKEMGKRWKLNFYGGLNNIWDETYASMLLVNASSFGGRPPRYFYPGLPRHYYGGLSLQFSL
ncbi:MAG: TonB-dependent receptor [Cyclobacteriaceae bacterium]|nr:TonB-dependent receptor [Cyclobacteriaceae bacterium]